MNRVRTWLKFSLAAAAAAIVFSVAWQEPPEGVRLLHADAEPQNWLTHGRTYQEQRYSTLAAINTGNVASLKLAWYYDLDTNRGQEATPLVVDGVLYTSTAWSKVVALDAATGRELWRYDPEVPPRKAFDGCCDVVNRGLAYDNGRLYLGTLDGRLISLDAKTGHRNWSVVTVDQSQAYTITGAPRVVRGKVLIGNGGAEFGVRGYITAYDAETGRKVWRFYTVPGDPAKGPDGEASDAVLAEKAAGTWFGKFWAAGGGGTVWDSIVYDAELNQLYIGVGNGSPWNHKIRSEGKGDNLFLSSIVALDPDTGKYLWHYQETPGDSWDFTAAQQITLANLKIAGVQHKVLMHAPKNGFFYVLDRSNGKLLSADPYVPITWATHVDLATGRPVEVPGARYENASFMNAPGAMGGHNWHPMAFSPRTGLVYIPVNLARMPYQNDTGYVYRPGQINTGSTSLPGGIPDDAAARKMMDGALTGALIAWDPIARKEAWRLPRPRVLNGGVLATAGDLVFQGTADRQFTAVDARTGKPLWQFDGQTGIMAGPITYSVKGRQFVAVMAGYGGGAIALPNFMGPRINPNGRVLAFAINGKAALPAFDSTPPPLQADVAPGTVDAVARGEGLFAANCMRCHGAATYSNGVLPDLKRSGALGDAQMWQDVVIGGALRSQGMISFAKIIKPAEAEDIRSYVVSKARILSAK